MWMDRHELRFRILVEYYNEFHNGYNNEDSAQKRTNAMAVPKNEINAAKNWLIDSNFVNGATVGNFGSPIPISNIVRINNYGVDYVESVMDTVFEEKNIPGMEDLSKSEKFVKFTKECLGSSGGEICRMAYDAIIKCMSSTPS